MLIIVTFILFIKSIWLKGLLLHNTLTKLTFYLLLMYPLYSQVSNGGDPKSIQAGLTDDIPQVIMPLVDRIH